MKRIFTFFSFALLSVRLIAQCGGSGGVSLTVQNPSFEGPSQPHVVPGPWQACYGTPDTQPGQWGFTQAPSNGSSYISALQSGSSSGGYQEGASQQLSSCMIAGTTYTFTLDLAFSNVYNTAEPGNCYGSLQIWGGNSICGKNESLWQSGVITNTGWQTYTITLTPTQNWCYISMAPYFITSCSGYINIMIDNLGPIVPPSPGLQATVNSDISCSQTINGNISCPPTSIILSGAFNGSPVNANILTDSTWTQNVTYPSGSAGTQNIFIVAYTQSGDTLNDTITFNLVEITPDFSASDVCAGNSMVFTDNSTISSGTITSWLWDFGDGTGNSNLQNPSHNYLLPGTYPVKLIVTSDLGCIDSITKTVQVYENPVADFSVANVCHTFPSQFNNQSTISSGTLIAAAWNFGDGTGTSSSASPAYTYLNPGTYTVSLTVTSDNSCAATISKTTVVNPVPVADFSADNACLNEPVNFINSSTVSSGSIISYTWLFGDAANSPLANPSHIYANPGTFSVMLSATSDSGCIYSVSKDVVINPLPFADFTTNNVCEDSIAGFTDNSTILSGNVVSYDWNFGDNTANSALQNPTHQYPAFGVYDVELIVVSDSGCADTVVKPIEIYSVPVASFITADVCKYALAPFFSNSTIDSGNVVSWFWDFGDGGSTSQENTTHLYSAPGTYSVVLTVASDNGCVDDTSQSITIFPVPVAVFSTNNVCQYDSAQFTDGSTMSNGTIDTYNWDFGDGTNSLLQNPSHLFSSPDTFYVELLVTSNNGCVDSITQPVIIHPVPQAAFTTNNECIYNNAQFTDNSTVYSGTIDLYNWNFGDGGTSSSQNSSHLYSFANTYTVQLLVTTGFNCKDSITNQITIHPKPAADFSFENKCVNDTAFFNDLSAVASGSISGWNWNFGNGNFSSSQTPYQVYSNADYYNVTLIVTTDSGCTDTITKITSRYPIPVANFVADSVCFNNSTQFYDSSNVSNITGDSINTYIWNFGDGTPLSGNSNPSHFYAGANNYDVTLIVISNHNCIDDITITIPVYPLPVADFTSTIVCLNTPPTQFQNTSTGTIVSYEWDFDDGNSAIEANPSHTYISAETFNVQLIVTTDKGCKDTIIETAKVNPLPLLDFSAATAGCEPFCTQFFGTAIPLGGATISATNWNFGDGNFSSQNPANNCYMDDGKYTVTFSATTSDGCTDDSVKKDYIVVWPKPIPGFDFEPQVASIFNPEITFTDLSSGGMQWFWDFGDKDTSAFQYPVHVYADTGTFTVMQIVTTINNCKDTIYHTVIIKAEFTIYIPNAFTPDGDGINDLFLPEGYGILPEDYSLYIFNRWGDVIYETHSAKGAWDGTLNGKPTKQDVYLYKIIVKDVFGEMHSFSGHVTLLRRE